MFFFCDSRRFSSASDFLRKGLLGFGSFFDWLVVGFIGSSSSMMGYHYWRKPLNLMVF
jgi:hypothetical protein